MTNDIRVIKRAQLSAEAYDQCISRAAGPRIYAYSWYLDRLAENWYAMVRGDYRAVMPVPFRKKLGLTYVFQPTHVQQLGVFSPEQTDQSPFLNKMLNRHLHVDYTFHAHSVEGVQASMQERPNLELSLDVSFDELLAGMKYNRRRDLKKANQFGFEVYWPTEDRDIKKTLNDFELHAENPVAEGLKRLIFNETIDASVDVLGIYKENRLVHLVIYGKDHDRVYYIFAQSTHNSARQHGASTMGICALLEKFSGQPLIFDFEGSALNGVRQFFESFGSRNQPYFHIHKTKISLPFAGK